jgi:hypothetical protein
MWVNNPNPNPKDDSTRSIRTYYFYISNDKLHDSYFVQHCLILHWDSVVKAGFTSINHWIGQMVAMVGSKVEFLGFLLLGILSTLVDVIVYGRFLDRGMERAPMTGQSLS